MIEFLGLWEELHNPAFNRVQFDTVRNKGKKGNMRDHATINQLLVHVRPRYDSPVVINGNTYTDGEFGHHYGLDKSEAISDKDREEVFIQLKEWLDG